MMPLDFKSYPLWIDIMVFALSAGAVWFAGTRVSRYADTISRQTGIGQAMIGLVLLGGITSLPEIAVTVSSALAGNAALAVNNLLGGVAMQVAILAVADAMASREALTSVIADPVVLMQGALDILLLALVASVISVGEIPLLGAGAGTLSILVLSLAAFWIVVTSQGRHRWHTDETDGHRRDTGNRQEPQAGRWMSRNDRESSLGHTTVKTIAAGATILVAGFLLSRTGEAIAVKTGLGSSFVGAVFLAISTSLPEASSVLSAVQLRRYDMAVSEVFGANLFHVGLVSVVDAVYAGEPVLNEVGRFSAVAALLGIIVTTLYIAGLVERRDRTILGMGVDSLAVLGAYLGGLILLYQLR
jgi:cation:H+ antiporter